MKIFSRGKLIGHCTDPNVVVDNDIPPLTNVYAFASRDHVGLMRNMLLDAGAVESDAMKERWDVRRRADACEDAWMRNFHRDPRP